MSPDIEAGERVGVILGIDRDAKSVDFVGYGVYQGDEVPGEEAAGSMANILRDAGVENPKIVLDQGGVAWGCEVWWGPEEEVRDTMAGLKNKGYTINIVNLEVDRKKYREKEGKNGKGA
jgi:hypothetical protein